MTCVINHSKDPACMLERDVWKAVATKVGEHYRYAREDASVNGSVHVWGQRGDQPLLKVDGVFLYAMIRFDNPSHTYRIENCTLVSDADDGYGTHQIVVRTMNGANANKTLQIYAGQPWTLLEAGIYTAEEWPRLEKLWKNGDLPSPWFDKTTLPLTK